MAQTINFAIVFAVLYFFALKPLLKIMREREEKIDKSIKDAKKIEEELVRTEKNYVEEIAKARREAMAIIEDANKQSEERKKDAVAKAKEEIGQIINKEKESIRAEKDKTMKEIKKELAGLIVASLEKVLAEKIDNKKDKEFIEKIIKQDK